MPEAHPILSYLLTPEMPPHRWRSSYVGVTSNVVRRLRQHNGELQGGAKETSSPHRQPWEVLVVVDGFADWDMLLQFESAWHRPQAQQYGEQAGPGVGTQGSPKRKMRELFELLNVSPWQHRRLTVTFTSAASSDVARSLGVARRWPASVTCAEQSLDDYVQRRTNVTILTDSGTAVARHRPAVRSLPANRLLAQTLFEFCGASRRRCLLCGKLYRQISTKGYTNMVTHLRIKHGNTFLAELRMRRAQ